MFGQSGISLRPLHLKVNDNMHFDRLVLVVIARVSRYRGRAARATIQSADRRRGIWCVALSDFTMRRSRRNQAVTLTDDRCGSAVFSRAGESYLVLANLDQSPREITCVLHPEKLPYPLLRPSSATRLAMISAPDGNPSQPAAPGLDVRALVGEGTRIEIPAADAIVTRASQ